MVIQAALLVAVHVQPDPDVTERVAAPPPIVALGDSGVTVKVHTGSWVTNTVAPATIRVPVRVPVAELGATV
jgi:hypothetical protein